MLCACNVVYLGVAFSVGYAILDGNTLSAVRILGMWGGIIGGLAGC